MTVNSCTFSLNREGVLCLKVQDEKETIKVKGVKAIRSLQFLDNLPYSSIRFVNGNVYLYDEDSRIIIEDYNEMLRSHMLDRCPRTKNIIISAYKEYRASAQRANQANQTTQAKKKKKRKLKPGVKKVLITSAMILAIMVAGRGIGSMADNNYPQDLNADAQVIETIIQNDSSGYLDDVSIEDIEIQETQTGIQEDDTVYFERAQDNSMSQKAQQARRWYGTVKKYAEMYGMSANLPMAVLTQESGGDNSYRDGLMQIQFWSWEDMPVRAYNFNTGKTETIVLTKTPNKYKGTNYTIYTQEDLKDPDINIKCGVIFLRYSILNFDGNVVYGTYAYNMGVTNIVNLINRYVSNEEYVTFDDVVSDPSFINDLVDLAKQTIDVGDWNYPNNVIQYAEGGEITFSMINDDGSIEVKTIQFEQGKGLGH